MEAKLIALLIVIFTYFFLPAIAQGQGFTNKAEAKNEVKNGLKEGKWIEWTDSSLISDPEGLGQYTLVVYKAGKLNGIASTYLVRGDLMSQVPYTNGKENGVATSYYDLTGRLRSQTPYINGKLNGVEKTYYEISQKLGTETTYADDKKKGVAKEYYESGKLQFETMYINDKENGVHKDYYESGKLKAVITYVNGVVKTTKN